jgi:hypothetical protein
LGMGLRAGEDTPARVMLRAPVTLVAIVALFALVAAAFSLLRLSRLPRAPLPPVLERTFDNLGAGDVVITPEGDFLVASRDEIAVDGVRARVFTLRSGREQRWLVVPAEGALLLATEPPETPRLATARKLERSSVELLPGA